MFQVITKGFDRVIRALDRLDKEAMREVGIIMRSHLREGVNYGRVHHLTGGTTETRLAVRSGNLRNAFWYEVKVLAGAKDVQGRLGFIRSSMGGRAQANPLVYAWMHHRGGTIRAKRGGYLTIPLEAARTKAGVSRGRARDFPNTFVRRSRQGHLIIWQKQGKQIVPLFVLKTYVRIPRRSTLDPTWRYIRPKMLAELRSGKLVQRFKRM